MSTSTLKAGLMNGWDYVLAITEDQVNKGLRIAYQGGNVGTAFPSMPKGQFTLRPEGSDPLVVTFGCPRIESKCDALKLCDLTIPLVDSTVPDGGVGRNLRLVITASLSCTETLVEEGGGPVSGSAKPAVHHEAFINFNAPEAIYKVVADGLGPSADRMEWLGRALRHKLREFHDHVFRVASFDARVEANPFVPRRVDVSFVRDAGQQGRHALVFAASLDTQGALKDGQLEFAAGVLPLDVPGALWIGPRVLLERLMLPMLKQSLKNGANPPDLRFDEKKGEISLIAAYQLPPARGKPTWVEKLRVCAASGGGMAIEAQVHIFNIDRWKNALTRASSRIDFGLKPDDPSVITASSKVVSSDTNIEDHRPWYVKFFLAAGETAGPGGLGSVVMAIMETQMTSLVSSGVAKNLQETLQVAATKMNGALQQIPTLADPMTGGHLVFERVAFVEGGAAFLGIRATAHKAAVAQG